MAWSELKRQVRDGLKDLSNPTSRLKTGAITHQMLAIPWACRVFRPTAPRVGSILKTAEFFGTRLGEPADKTCLKN